MRRKYDNVQVLLEAWASTCATTAGFAFVSCIGGGAVLAYVIKPNIFSVFVGLILGGIAALVLIFAYLYAVYRFGLDGELQQDGHTYYGGLLDVPMARHVEVIFGTEPHGSLRTVIVNVDRRCVLRVGNVSSVPRCRDVLKNTEEVVFTDAPVWYSAEEAHAWAAGYNAAREDPSR